MISAVESCQGNLLLKLLYLFSNFEKCIWSLIFLIGSEIFPFLTMLSDLKISVLEENLQLY